MDFQSLKEQIAGISLYDVKAAVRKAQNGKTLSPFHTLGKVLFLTKFVTVVMNYTEMEAKVRTFNRF